MSDVTISVLKDPLSPNGGEAIIRLTGVALVPPGSTFRIDPIEEDAGAHEQDGWPRGDLRPRSLRITKDGVDMIIGPDVVEAPALLPGTPVTISVPAVSARMELRWPSLPMAQAPRRGAVVVSGQQRAAEIAARAAAEKIAAAEAAEAMRLQAEALEQQLAGDREGQRRPGDATPWRATDEGAIAAPSLAIETADERRLIESLAMSAPDVASGLQPTGRTGEAPLPAPMPPRPILPAMGEVATPPAAAPKPAPLKPLGSATSPAPAGKGETHRLPAPAVALQKTTPGDRNAVSGTSRPTRWLMPFVMGLVAATIGFGGYVALQGRLPALKTAAPAGLADLGAGRTATFAAPRLAAVLDVPALSPLGKSADGVSLEDALRLADAGLYGAADQRNRAEAKFWLRKALSMGLGDRRLQWAMTQLGTLYATPDSGAPDYQAARELWELAASKEDPVALCFLASLHEHGLGVGKSARQAMIHYERAKARGGCKGVDEAIARVKREMK